MMQYPDFEEKQIIFIQSYELKWLSLDNDNLVIKEDGTIKNKVSLYKVFAIFIIGEMTLSSGIIQKMQEFWVSLILLKKNFSPYAIIGNETQWNFVLRKKQYAASEEDMLEIAKHIIQLKTQNQLQLLKNIREKSQETKESIQKILDIKKQIDTGKDYEVLLWYEGNVSKIFFQNYYREIGWYRRAPRTKCDIKNLLLDIGYTYLFHFIEALLRLYGFDTYYGVYHRTWYQRKSLALDLMEPFCPIIDRALLKAYNLGQIDEKDFRFQNGQYQLDWKLSQKYTQIFFKEIFAYKKEMFYFVKDYYKFFMKGREHFPEFYIKSQ